ncbi:MAG: hypothetical protein M9944_12340 [Rhizobiaceae bacterium]|nr:hypothetical protein [Rhizobiaceae bacterium]
MKKLAIAAFLVSTSLTMGASVAQEAKQDLTPAQQTENRMILETARNLVSYGEAKSDPLALVTAAKMMASVPGRVLADDAKGEAGADKAPAFDIEGVLKKAEDIAQGDELITKVAGDVRTMAEANSKAVCYWEYYCYYNGWCEYAYACW